MCPVRYAGVPTLAAPFELRARPVPAPSLLTSRHPAVDALPAGSRIASFEIQAVIARGPTTFVYLARDIGRGLPVAIKEFAPARHGAASDSSVARERQTDAPTDSAVQRGLRAFIAEAQMLAACHHPALVRVDAVVDANGTAYRVMPFYTGHSLVQVRRGSGRAPDEATLLAWADELAGALQALHDTGHAHGGVSPDNLFLLSDGRPLLFGAGSRGHQIRIDSVESLFAGLGLGLSVHSAAARLPELDADAATGNGAAVQLTAQGALASAPSLSATVSAAVAEACADDSRALAATLRFGGRGDWGRAAPAGAVGEPTPASAGAAGEPTPAPAGAAGEPTPASARASNLLGRAQPAPAGGLAGTAQLRAAAAASASISASRVRPILAHRPQAISAAAALPRLAPPQRASVSQRARVPLWVALFGLLSIGVVAFMGHVIGAWNRVPSIGYERGLQTPPRQVAASASLPSTRSAASVPTRIATAPQPTRAGSEGVTPAVPTEPVVPVPVPVPETVNVPVPVLETVPVTVPVPALSAVPESKAEGQAVQRTGSRASAAAGTAKLSNPSTVCGSKTNFALERCMQIQCQTAQWVAHPQCVSRRAG